MSRHQKPQAVLPPWAPTEKNDCLLSVGEEAYTARNLAVVGWHADKYPQCQQLLAAGDKSRRVLDDTKATVELRTKNGERALRKYWEARACARRLGST